MSVDAGIANISIISQMSGRVRIARKTAHTGRDIGSLKMETIFECKCGCRLLDHELIISKTNHRKSCPVHNQAVLSRYNVCEDCGDPIVARSAGNMPARCKPCAKTRKDKLCSAKYRKNKQTGRRVILESSREYKEALVRAEGCDLFGLRKICGHICVKPWFNCQAYRVQM